MASYSVEHGTGADGAGTVVITLHETADAQAVTLVLDELEALAAAADRPLSVLVDESAVTAGFVSPADVRRFVSVWRGSASLRSAQIAIVAPDIVVYGLNRMVHGLGGAAAEEQIGLFRARDDAAAWLESRAP